MADSKLITSIGEELECPVCAEYFTDACFLSCMHTFCRNCLQKCDKTYGRGGKSSMHCPLCRKVTTLTKNGVAGLQTDFTCNKLVTRLKEGLEDRRKAAGASQNSGMTCQSCQEGTIIAYCTSCCHFICCSCQSLHTKLGAMRTHEVITLKELRKGKVTVVRSPNVQFCIAHKLDTVCFCYTCVTYVCDLCLLIGHDGHDCREPTYNRATVDIPPSNSKRETVRKTVGQLVMKINSFREQKVKVKRLRANIKRHFGALKDEVKSSHDLRVRTVTRALKEKCDDMVKELIDDEELLIAKVASVDENLGHAESRALQAKVIGDNAVTDGQHAEIVLVNDYVNSVASSFNEDSSAESTLKVLERYTEGVVLKYDTVDSIDTLVSFGHIFHPETWDVAYTCELPSVETKFKSIQFSSSLESFLVSSASAIHSIDLEGKLSHVVDLQDGLAVRDMATTPDGSTCFLLCQDNQIRVFSDQKWDKYTGVIEIPRVTSDSTVSCLAVNRKGTVIVGDQSSQTVVGYSSKAFKKMTDISPIKMVFTSSGDVAAVCRNINEVGDGEAGSWNQAGVTVRVFGVAERWENMIVQNNWQAAAVATKHGPDGSLGKFFALGIYVLDDGRQLASLAEYDNFGTKKESMFQDMDLPVDLNCGTGPVLAADTSNTTLAVYTGKEVRLYRKQRFNVE